MPLTLTTVTPPSDEPISLTDVKTFLRVDATDQDTIIAMNLTAARLLVESKAHRQLMPATLKLSLDAFPGNWHHHERLHRHHYHHEWPLRHHHHRAIQLPRSPATAVISITYIDTNGATQTLDPSKYRVDAESEPARIEPAYATCWPCTQPVINAVSVTYTAGYADEGSVPAQAKQAILLLLSHWYENREAVVPGQSSGQLAVPVALAFDALVDSFSVPYLGEDHS